MLGNTMNWQRHPSNKKDYDKPIHRVQLNKVLITKHINYSKQNEYTLLAALEKQTQKLEIY